MSHFRILSCLWMDVDNCSKDTNSRDIFLFILYMYWRALKVVLIRYVSSLSCPRNKRNLPQLFPFHWTEEGFLLPEIKILYRKFCILSSLRKFRDSRNLELEIDELSNYQRGKNQDWPNLKKKKKFRSLLSFFEETNSVDLKKVRKINEKNVSINSSNFGEIFTDRRKSYTNFSDEKEIKKEKRSFHLHNHKKKKTCESLSPYFFNQVKKVTK